MKLSREENTLPDWLYNLAFKIGEVAGMILVVLIVVGVSPLLLMLAAVFGVTWVKRLAFGPTKDWRPWFAWYPVEASREWREGVRPWVRVWWEWVERRSDGLGHTATHREPPA